MLVGNLPLGKSKTKELEFILGNLPQPKPIQGKLNVYDHLSDLLQFGLWA